MARICVDSTYFKVNGSGELTLVPGQTGFWKRVIIRDPGTTTFNLADYPGVQRLFVQVQGAGGGSAGANAAAAQLIARPGGAGGAYAESVIQASALGASVSVTVGAGGAAGTTTAPGSPGGSSSFGGFAVAPGGDGGTVFMTSGTGPDTTSGVPGALATAATGDLVSGGGGSGAAIRLDASHGVAGAGGDSRLGFGGFSRASAGDGGAPRGRGSGGGGSLSTGGAVNGAAGSDGIVIVWLYR